MHAAPEEQEVVRLRILVRELLDVLLLMLQQMLDLVRDHAHLVHRVAAIVDIIAAQLADVERQQVERGELRGERLRRCHADLRTGIRVDHAFRHACCRGADHIADREQLPAMRLRFLHAGDRVGRLAGLRHADDQRAVVDDRIAVAVLRAVIDIDRNARRVFEQELADQSRVPRRAARDDLHLLNAGPILGRQLQIVEEDLARLLEHAAVERVAHGALLLVDLLEHVVPVAFLLGHHGVPHDLLRRTCDLGVLLVEYFHRLLIGDRILAVFEIDDVARVGEERGDVGRDDVLVLAEADDERRAVLRGDDRARLGAVDHHQCEVAFELFQCLFDCVDELRPAFDLLFDQMGDDFRVRLRLELMSRFLQALLEREEVLDNAVVDDHDLSGAVAMRMGIVLVRLAVRRPARVTHAERTVQRLVAELRFEVRQLPLGAYDFHSVAVDDGDPRAVVAAVLELLQSTDEDRHHITFADVSDDSAHVVSITIAAVKRLCALAALALLLACGKRGDPKPPVPMIPQATSDLVVTQRGSRVVLAWSYPALTTAGKTLGPVRRVDVYRYSEPLPVAQAEPLGDFSKVPQLTPNQFNKLKTKVDSIEGEKLPAASNGAKLTFEDNPDFQSTDKRPVRLTYAVVTEGGTATGALSNLAILVPIAPP